MTEYNGTRPCKGCEKPLPPSTLGYTAYCFECGQIRTRQHRKDQTP
jgi:hypothetical protein